jgi:hypothetical protein
MSIFNHVMYLINWHKILSKWIFFFLEYIGELCFF